MRGNEVQTTSFGHHDTGLGLKADENTIYNMASISKSLTAVAIGILVAENNLSWGQKICEILPSLQHFDSQIQQAITVMDLLSHRAVHIKTPNWAHDPDITEGEAFIKEAFG